MTAEQIDWSRQPDGWGVTSSESPADGYGDTRPTPTPREQIIVLLGAIGAVEAIIDVCGIGVVTSGTTADDIEALATEAKHRLQDKLDGLWSITDGIKDDQT